eukprot:gene17249-biopygen5954
MTPRRDSTARSRRALKEAKRKKEAAALPPPAAAPPAAAPAPTPAAAARLGARTITVSGAAGEMHAIGPGRAERGRTPSGQTLGIGNGDHLPSCCGGDPAIAFSPSHNLFCIRSGRALLPPPQPPASALPLAGQDVGQELCGKPPIPPLGHAF